jgi:hypothetical protein
MLLPNPLPYADVVDNNVEEEEISEHSREQCDENSIEDLLPSSLGLVKSANALSPKIPDESDCETHEPNGAKYPLIISVESVGE